VANTVTMRFRVLEDGSLQQIANQANQAAAGIDRTSEANARLHKTTRGASNMQGNQTRAFAATASSAGGLVAAYATLMAHTFALTAAFGALQRASALDQLEQGLIAVGNAAGQNLPFVAQNLQNITEGAITLKEAMEATALATSAGFSTSQLEGLTKVAKGASLALGRDMGDALTRLVKGTAKLEPEILDELGIMVRLDEASQKYADSIGVVVSDLSRFQKQQAFLNATLEQGQKKFSMIFENVDAEPFAQLSAQFRDMVKDITTFINKGAIPLVNFLSSFPTAMVGGLLLLASSVTKKILPALGDLSASNKAMASVAAAEASRAGRAISTQYVNAVAQVNTAFKTVPASLRAVEAGFRSGSLSLAEYRAHLVTLQRSETQRAARLNTGNEATRAQRQIELNQIRELRIATEQLIATEGRRGQISSAGSRARSTSHIARRQSVAQDMIGQSGPAEGFRVAARAARGHMATVGRTAGPLNVLRVGFQAAGASAALFGSALLNIVPIIGQVLFFGSLLLPLFGNMFKKSGLAKATDEVVDSFSSFARISAQLAEHLRSVKDAEEAFASTLAVRVGVTQQITAGIAKMIAAKDEDDLEDEADALTNLAERQNNVARNRAKLAAADATNKKLSATLNANLSRSILLASGAEKEYNRIVADNNSVSKESIRMLLAEAKAKAKASGMTEALAIEIDKYNTLVESGVLSGDGNISSAALTEALEGVSDPLAALKQETAGVIEITTKMANETTKATNEQAGKYGELFDSVKGLRTGLVNVAKQAKLVGETEIRPVPQDTIEQIGRLQKALKLDGDALAGSFVDQLQVIQDKIAANNVLIATSAIESKKLSDSAQLLSQFSSANAEAKKEELSFTKQALIQTRNGLQAKYENLAASTKEGVITNDMLKVQAEIDRVSGRITAHKNDSLKVAIAEVQQEKAKFNLLSKSAASSLSLAKSNLKIKQNDLKVANLLEKKDAKEKSPAAAAKKLFDETKKDRLAIIESERKAKHQTIKMEYKLLEAQTKLARAQAEDAGLDTAIYDQLLQLQTSARMDAQMAANKTATAAISDIGVEGVTTNIAKEDEDKNIALDKRDRAREVLGSAASTMAGLGPEGESLSAGMEMIEGFSASFDTALSTMADSSATNSEKISAGLGVASSLIGGMMKMQQAATADKLRGIDQEIAAEKARDGQSAASAGKIKALEAKKTAVARKAFEDEKKMKIAQTIISTAQGAIAAYTSLAMIPIVGPALGAAAAAMVVAMGAKQVSMIQATSFSGGGSVGGGVSSMSVGSRSNSVDLAKGNNQAGETGYMRGASGQGGMQNFTPAFTGYKNRASGGNTGFIVGEQGPELCTPAVPGDITSADDTADMQNMAPTNVNFSIQAIDASGVEDMLTIQRGNIIRMIREAANEQGQLFLEAVEETRL